MAYNQNLFKFNLIPPISDQEVSQLESRDNSILYSFILIFSAMLVFVLLNVLLLIVVQGRKASLEKSISQLESTIIAEGEPLQKHGEIILKGSLLSPILLQDIKITELLDYTSQIAPNSEITKYGREMNGEFILEISVGTYKEAFEIVRKAKSNSNLSGVTIDTLSRLDKTNTDNVTMNIRFSLTDTFYNGS